MYQVNMKRRIRTRKGMKTNAQRMHACVRARDARGSDGATRARMRGAYARTQLMRGGARIPAQGL